MCPPPALASSPGMRSGHSWSEQRTGNSPTRCLGAARGEGPYLKTVEAGRKGGGMCPQLLWSWGCFLLYSKGNMPEKHTRLGPSAGSLADVFIGPASGCVGSLSPLPGPLSGDPPAVSMCSCSQSVPGEPGGSGTEHARRRDTCVSVCARVCAVVRV